MIKAAAIRMTTIMSVGIDDSLGWQGAIMSRIPVRTLILIKSRSCVECRSL
jgi:hypothetical protein